MLLIRAAAVPDVAVTSRRCDIPLLVNSTDFRGHRRDKGMVRDGAVYCTRHGRTVVGLVGISLALYPLDYLFSLSGGAGLLRLNGPN